MAFKPKSSNKDINPDFESFNVPAPRSGLRKARLSLIVDLGVQNREDFEEADGTKTPQKPCQQVIAFADLVNDIVDYGGSIGKQQYRLLLNKVFQRVPVGINFTTTPPKDNKGNKIEGKPWGLHPANLLTKIAKAVGKEDVIYDVRGNPNSLDIEQLLDIPFMANVEVIKREHKEGKLDKDGNVIVYTNVNFKGAVPVPEGDDGEPQVVAELTQPAKCITFDNARAEDIKFIRPSILAIIKQANDYAGSTMQAAIEGYEAEFATSQVVSEPAPEKELQKAKETAKPKAQPASKASEPLEDDDIPF